MGPPLTSALKGLCSCIAGGSLFPLESSLEGLESLLLDEGT